MELIIFWGGSKSHLRPVYQNSNPSLYLANTDILTKYLSYNNTKEYLKTTDNWARYLYRFMTCRQNICNDCPKGFCADENSIFEFLEIYDQRNGRDIWEGTQLKLFNQTFMSPLSFFPIWNLKLFKQFGAKFADKMWFGKSDDINLVDNTVYELFFEYEGPGDKSFNTWEDTELYDLLDVYSAKIPPVKSTCLFDKKKSIGMSYGFVKGLYDNENKIDCGFIDISIHNIDLFVQIMKNCGFYSEQIIKKIERDFDNTLPLSISQLEEDYGEKNINELHPNLNIFNNIMYRDLGNAQWGTATASLIMGVIFPSSIALPNIIDDQHKLTCVLNIPTTIEEYLKQTREEHWNLHFWSEGKIAYNGYDKNPFLDTIGKVSQKKYEKLRNYNPKNHDIYTAVCLSGSLKTSHLLEMHMG